MQVLQIIGILVVFIGITVLMIMKKLPTILALPSMAILLALVAGVPVYDGSGGFDIVGDIIADGSVRLASTIMAVFFGAWFGQILVKTGITKAIIKKAAELAGDRPMAVAIAFYIVASLIFAGASGLGIVILVGSIILPIMISAGVAPVVAAIVLVFANASGVIFNSTNFAVYVGILGQELSVVAGYAWIAGVPLVIVCLASIFLMCRKNKSQAWAMPTEEEDTYTEDKPVRTIALIAPVLPVVLIYTCTMLSISIDVTAAIMFGIIVTMLLATPKRPIQILSSSFVEGIQDGAGAAGLMIGIGMLLKAVASPSPVAELLLPVFQAIIPTNAFVYVILFFLLAIFAIYRGPMNMYGLGAGVATLFITGGLSATATMLAFMINSNLQAVCDPTNTHNVWACDYTKTDVNEVLKKTIVPLLVCSLIGLTIAAFVAF